MKKNILFAITLLIAVAVQAQNPAVVIPGTQLIKFNSTIVGQEYDLLISLPGNYEQQPDKTYPVQYVLDAQWDFPLAVSLYGSQYYDGFIPGTIVVGITWGGTNPDPNRLRFRDFTPTVTTGQQPAGTGNAAKFLEFIKKELIPFIDSKFRTKKDDRVITGSSLGGLFTLYALFNEPDLFKRYILTSPALGWGNGVIYDHEKKFAEKKLKMDARLFMAHGELEGPAQFVRFADDLKKRQIPGLEIQTRILENTGHSGTKAEGYTRGLQWVFARPSLKLSSSVLKSYAGIYQLGTDTVRIEGDSDKLVAVTRGNNRFVLEAESESDFYYKGSFLNVHFTKDNSGNTAGFQMEQFGGSRFAKKIGQ